VGSGGGGEGEVGEGGGEGGDGERHGCLPKWLMGVRAGWIGRGRGG
jgi:hypothetical protein